MTNEYGNDMFGSTQDPAQAQDAQPPFAPPQSQPDENRAVFDKTVFGATAQPEQPAPPVQPTQPIPPAQPEQPTQPVQEPPTVYAERVSDYDNYRSPSAVQEQQDTAQWYHGFYDSTTPAEPAPAPQAKAPAAEPQKKTSDGKGLHILFSVIAVIVVGFVCLAIGSHLGTNKSTSAESTQSTSGANTAQAGAPELVTSASPSSDSVSQAGTVLTPTQIASKVRPWSVGILVYSRTSSGVASEGSGVLWKEDVAKKYTYIITCAHVIDGSGMTYTVQTEDGTTYDAELVGLDAKTDLGVLRIEKTGLELAEFGDSSKLQVGDPVYAIGNPGGTEFFGSFTDGVVSAIDRSVKSTYTMICIQHTAAINPGNSGGALVNQFGQVVGINSQKIMSTEYEGMGFAIPIKSAQNIVNSLALYGYIKDRPKLGITYAEAVNYQQYSMLIKIKGLPSGSLIITGINDDSSLANTDVRQYDMITKVNGEDLTKPEVLLSKIDNGKIGDKLKLTICRMDNNYQTTEFTVTATLVEDKKEAEKTTTTTQPSIDPYDFFNYDFFKGLF